MKAALFDLDGVLVDTEGNYTRIWTEIDRQFPTGIPDFALRIKGTTLENILATYFRPEDHQAVINMLSKAESNMKYTLFDGVDEFIWALVRAHIPTAMVTSSNEQKMGRLFAQLPTFRFAFTTVVTDAQITHSKPDPEGYLLAAKEMGVDPADCYVFEDSFNGLRAGRASGATVIALATSNPASELAPYADAVIPSFVGFTPAQMLSITKKA